MALTFEWKKGLKMNFTPVQLYCKNWLSKYRSIDDSFSSRKENFINYCATEFHEKKIKIFLIDHNHAKYDSERRKIHFN